MRKEQEEEKGFIIIEDNEVFLKYVNMSQKELETRFESKMQRIEQLPLISNEIFKEVGNPLLKQILEDVPLSRIQSSVFE